MVEWQKRAVEPDRLLIVANSESHFPEKGAEMVWTSEGGGPARALQIALSRVEEPCVVAFADTWWARTPPGSDWVGVCPADGGRPWDWVGYSTIRGEHYFARDHFGAHTKVKACVGLYAFSDPDALRSAVDAAMDAATGDEVHMVDVLNRYELPLDLAHIPEWMDVGDMESWRRTDAALRSVA